MYIYKNKVTDIGQRPISLTFSDGYTSFKTAVLLTIFSKVNTVKATSSASYPADELEVNLLNSILAFSGVVSPFDND